MRQHFLLCVFCTQLIISIELGYGNITCAFYALYLQSCSTEYGELLNIYVCECTFFMRNDILLLV